MNYHSKHHKSLFDKEQIKQLVEDRYDQANYLKTQVEDSLLGFNHMVCFLEIADKKLYPVAKTV